MAIEVRPVFTMVNSIKYCSNCNTESMTLRLDRESKGTGDYFYCEHCKKKFIIDFSNRHHPRPLMVSVDYANKVRNPKL
jgi:hypothetical protein